MSGLIGRRYTSISTGLLPLMNISVDEYSLNERRQDDQRPSPQAQVPQHPSFNRLYKQTKDILELHFTNALPVEQLTLDLGYSYMAPVTAKFKGSVYVATIATGINRAVGCPFVACVRCSQVHVSETKETVELSRAWLRFMTSSQYTIGLPINPGQQFVWPNCLTQGLGC